MGAESEQTVPLHTTHRSHHSVYQNRKTRLVRIPKRSNPIPGSLCYTLHRSAHSPQAQSEQRWRARLQHNPLPAKQRHGRGQPVVFALIGSSQVTLAVVWKRSHRPIAREPFCACRPEEERLQTGGAEEPAARARFYSAGGRHHPALCPGLRYISIKFSEIPDTSSII